MFEHIIERGVGLAFFPGVAKLPAETRYRACCGSAVPSTPQGDLLVPVVLRRREAPGLSLLCHRLGTSWRRKLFRSGNQKPWSDAVFRKLQ